MREVSRVLPYQFMGREADTAGLYYYRARYYSPMTAGFISEDPARFAGGQLSFYAGFRGIHWTTTIHTDCGPSPSQLLMVLVVRLNLEKTLKRGNGFGVVDSGRVWKMALVLTRLENALVEMRHRVTEPLWGLMWKSGLRRDFGLGIPYKGLLV